MGFSSIWHWVVVLLIVLLLFGAGKLPKVMGDLAKGIKNFKAGLKDEDEDATAASNAPASGQVLPNQPVPPAAQPTAAQPAAAQPAAQDPGVKKDETART